jgi:hypothetical protein
MFLGALIQPRIWTTIQLANRAVFRRCAHSILCTSILTNVLDLPEVAAHLVHGRDETRSTHT